MVEGLSFSVLGSACRLETDVYSWTNTIIEGTNTKIHLVSDKTCRLCNTSTKRESNNDSGYNREAAIVLFPMLLRGLGCALLKVQACGLDPEPPILNPNP